MAIIYCDIYRQKCRIFFDFRFLCSNFDGHFKDQNFKTYFSASVCIERIAIAILQFSESLNTKELSIKKI